MISAASAMADRAADVPNTANREPKKSDIYDGVCLE